MVASFIDRYTQEESPAVEMYTTGYTAVHTVAVVTIATLVVMTVL